MMTIVNAHEVETHFSQLLMRIMRGEKIIIAKAGKPVAVLSPIDEEPVRRVPGGDAGKVMILEGFDDPLPEFDI